MTKNRINIADIIKAYPINEPVYVDVLCSGQIYECEIEQEEEGLRLSLDVKPEKHHIEGLLFSGADESKKGMEIRSFLMEKNLFPTYWEDRITYARIVPLSNYPAEEINRFVRDVCMASTLIGDMLAAYISNLPAIQELKFKRKNL